MSLPKTNTLLFRFILIISLIWLISYLILFFTLDFLRYEQHIRYAQQAVAQHTLHLSQLMEQYPDQMELLFQINENNPERITKYPIRYVLTHENQAVILESNDAFSKARANPKQYIQQKIQFSINSQSYILWGILNRPKLFDEICQNIIPTLWILPILFILIIGISYKIIPPYLQPLQNTHQHLRQIETFNLYKKMSITASPIQDWQKLIESIHEMQDRLQSGIDKIRQFTGDAAHELKTPLTSMRGTLEVALARERSISEYQTYLASVLEETQRLIDLTEKLLLLTRIDQQNMEKHKTTVDMTALLKKIYNDFLDIAVMHGIRCSLNTTADCFTFGITENLERVIINLLDNAIKHSPPESEIRICISKGLSWITIEIEDTGEGIAEKHLPHIFERFYRVNSKIRPESSGHGLGLSLCQAIIEEHGGKISVQSQIGVSTRFSILLPRQD